MYTRQWKCDRKLRICSITRSITRTGKIANWPPWISLGSVWNAEYISLFTHCPSVFLAYTIHALVTQEISHSTMQYGSFDKPAEICCWKTEERCSVKASKNFFCFMVARLCSERFRGKCLRKERAMVNLMYSLWTTKPLDITKKSAGTVKVKKKKKTQPGDERRRTCETSQKREI